MGVFHSLVFLPSKIFVTNLLPPTQTTFHNNTMFPKNKASAIHHPADDNNLCMSINTNIGTYKYNMCVIFWLLKSLLSLPLLLAANCCSHPSHCTITVIVFVPLLLYFLLLIFILDSSCSPCRSCNHYCICCLSWECPGHVLDTSWT